MSYDFFKIGKYIRDLRESENLSQVEFLQELKNLTGLKMSRATLGKIENGEKESFTLEFLLSVSVRFDMRIGTLLLEKPLQDNERVKIITHTKGEDD